MAPALVVRVSGNLDGLRAALKGTEELIKTNTAGMQKLANSFQGERLVQHAKNVAGAIEQVGIKTLNTAEAARSLSVLERAMDKMLRTGEQIPVSMTKTAAELRRVVDVSDLADKSVNRITASYRQFDGILQSLGINIGPYVRGLEDITNLVTKGIPGLGVFGAAAAVVATALASWKVGEHIGKTSGLTDAIARGTAVLKGYGDVAQQEMLAKMQSIELTGRAAEMWKLQAESVEAATNAAQAHTDEMRREGMVAAGNAGQMAALAGQLADLKQKRDADAKALAEQNRLKSIFGEQTQANTAQIKEETKALDARADSIKRIQDAEAARKKQVDDFMNAPTLNDRPAGLFTTDIRRLTKTDLDRLRSLNPLKSGDQNLRDELDRLESMEGNYAPKSGAQFAQMQRDMYLLAQLRNFFSNRSFADGGTNIPGGWAMVGERGPEMVKLPGGSDVVPNHRLGGTTVHLKLDVHVGNVLTSGEQLADFLSDVVMRRLMASGFLNPSPA